MKYKVGDRVIIGDLIEGRRYFMNDYKCEKGCLCQSEMMKYSNKTAVIKSCEYNIDRYKIDLDGEYWYWTDEMFEGFSDFTKQDLKDGDYVTDRDGCEYIVSLKFNRFIDKNRKHISIYVYDKNLNMILYSSNEYDIMKVERNGEVIWEREEKSQREILVDKLQAQMDEIKRKIDELRE